MVSEQKEPLRSQKALLVLTILLVILTTLSVFCHRKPINKKDPIDPNEERKVYPDSHDKTDRNDPPIEEPV